MSPPLRLSALPSSPIAATSAVPAANTRLPGIESAGSAARPEASTVLLLMVSPQNDESCESAPAPKPRSSGGAHERIANPRAHFRNRPLGSEAHSAGILNRHPLVCGESSLSQI